jgi:hypothetical protein
MISSTVEFAPAEVAGQGRVDARRYAGVAVPPVVRPVAPMTWCTGAPTARLRALALEVGRPCSGPTAVLPTQHPAGFAPAIDHPTNDPTPLGIHSPGRPSS